MATKKEHEAIRRAAGDLEMTVTRFSETYFDKPGVYWADRRTAHTDLADGWAWAINALGELIPLITDPEWELMRDAMAERLMEYRRQLMAMYDFKTYTPATV